MCFFQGYDYLQLVSYYYWIIDYSDYGRQY